MNRPAAETPVRFDLQVIASWIEPNARVLDLGCGTGSLLAHLKAQKGVRPLGIEKYEHKVLVGIERGLSIVHGDMNEEVRDFPDASFDYVILSQALMQVYRPEELITEMLRVGRRAVVSFPNFAHLPNRLMMLFTGRAPVSRELPYEWHDTPNIRVITLRDFRRFCAAHRFPIAREAAINTHHHDTSGHIVHVLPGLRASYGIFLLGENQDAGASASR